MSTKYMLFDKQRCFGCNACVVACQQEYGLPAQIRFNRVELDFKGLTGPTRADLDLEFKPMVCVQCTTAPCLNVCPVGAISRGAGDLVLTDRRKCIGCRLCTTSTGCPHGMRSMDSYGKAVKCDFCEDRGETEPYCVKTCPAKARQLVTQVAAPTGTMLPNTNGAAGAKVYYVNIPIPTP